MYTGNYRPTNGVRLYYINLEALTLHGTQPYQF